MPDADSTSDLVITPPTGDGLETARMRGAIGTRLFGTDTAPPRLGRFSVLEPIGSGGMGVVYAAYDPQLDRRIALKVLRVVEGEASPHAARLLREAQTLAKLNHPNVIVVHEAGVHSEHVYIAMEFVTGGTLASWCERNPIGETRRFERLLDLFVQAARGLAAAHDAGLVHRDLKPANLLVDEHERLRVADFGLARDAELAADDAADDAGTGAGAISGSAGFGARGSRHDAATEGWVGTPAYMPPEQIEGRRADARSDQWALCATFWEAAYGERPFHADSFSASALARIEGRLATPPSRAEVPAWFRGILARGLAADPAERFADAAAMLAAIDRGRARLRSRRLGALAIAVVAVAGAAAAAWPARDVPVSPCVGAARALDDLWSPQHAAELSVRLAAPGDARGADTASRVTSRVDAFAERWREGAQSACVAARARGELDATVESALEIPTRRMECYRDARVQLDVVLEAVRAAPSAARAAMLVQALPDLRRCEDESSGIAWDMGAGRDAAEALARGSAAANLGDLAAARRALDVAWAAMEGLSVPNLEARAFLAEATIHRRLDDDEEAFASAERALGAAEAGDDPGDTVHAWLHLADAARSVEKLDDAQFYLERADSLTRRAGDPLWLRARITRAQARLSDRRGDTGAALRSYEQAREELAQLYGEHALPTIEILRDAATTARYAGKRNMALSYAEQAVTASAELLGPSHQETARAKVTLAIMLSDAGDEARALPLFEDVSAVARSNEDMGPKDRITALVNHAQSLGNLRRLDEARMLMGEAAELARALLQPDDPVFGVIASISGAFALDAGDHEAAIAIYEPLRVNAPGPDVLARRENAISICVNLATAYARSGEVRRADAVVRDCEAMLDRIEAPDPIRHGAAYRYVADVLATIGQTARARDAYARALTLLETQPVAAVEAAEAQLGFAALLLEAGEREAAADYLDRARTGAETGSDDLRARVDALAAKLTVR